MTASKTASKSSSSKSSSSTSSNPSASAPSAAGKKAKPGAQDAIALLKADHHEVSALFAAFEKTRSATEKKRLVTELCTALRVHTQIEEEIFYPAVQASLKDKLMVPEALVEHAGVKDLLDQLDGAEPDGAMYDARVTVLSEYVKHHVKEEHEGMFPKAAASSVDLVALGARMAERKEALTQALDTASAGT